MQLRPLDARPEIACGSTRAALAAVCFGPFAGVWANAAVGTAMRIARIKICLNDTVASGDWVTLSCLNAADRRSERGNPSEVGRVRVAKKKRPGRFSPGPDNGQLVTGNW